MFSLSICKRNLTRISFAVLAAIATDSALSAPPLTQLPDPAIVAYAKVKGSHEGLSALEHIRAKGVERNTANVKLLREALASRSLSDERATIIAILARLYDRTKQDELNAAIRSDLALQTKSFDQKVAKAAVFGISRLGGDESLKEVLIQARSQGHIDEDAFAGEIARNIRFFAPAQQTEYLALLAKSPSGYGIDVLTSHLSNPLFLKQYSLDSLKSIATILEKREPKFPSGIGEYGMTDGFRYTSWLLASAAIQERLGKGSSVNFVLAKLTDPNVDPRKVLAFLSDPQSNSFVNQIPREKFTPAIDKMNAFRESFPTSAIIQDIHAVASNRIGMSK
jgi:hypothetical protein